MIGLFTRNDTKSECVHTGLFELPVGELHFLPFAECVGDEGLMPLAKSISMLGMQEPITVRKRGDGSFEVICGQRRVRAARLAGIEVLPCFVAELSDSGAYAARLSSIIHSRSGDCFLIAELIACFCSSFRMSEQQAAILLGISRKRVAGLLRLMSFSSEQRERMSSHRLNERHAAVILRQPLAEREELIDTAIKDELSPRALEQLIRTRAEESKKRLSYLRRAEVLSDRRLFFNTVDKAVSILRLAGVNVSSEKRSSEGFTELLIRFPKEP